MIVRAPIVSIKHSSLVGLEFWIIRWGWVRDGGEIGGIYFFLSFFWFLVQLTRKTCQIVTKLNGTQMKVLLALLLSLIGTNYASIGVYYIFPILSLFSKALFFVCLLFDWVIVLNIIWAFFCLVFQWDCEFVPFSLPPIHTQTENKCALTELICFAVIGFGVLVCNSKQPTLSINTNISWWWCTMKGNLPIFANDGNVNDAIEE